MIDVKNLSKSFGDHLVLDGIYEHICPGEKVVNSGPLRLRKVHLSAVSESAGDAYRRKHHL